MTCRSCRPLKLQWFVVRQSWSVGVKVFAVFLFKLKNAEIILEQENSLFCKIGNYSLIVMLLLLNFKSKCPSLQYVFVCKDILFFQSLNFVQYWLKICKTFNLNLLVHTKLGCGHIQSQFIKIFIKFYYWDEQKGPNSKLNQSYI